jgi:glycosyltransferase XagB
MNILRTINLDNAMVIVDFTAKNSHVDQALISDTTLLNNFIISKIEKINKFINKFAKAFRKIFISQEKAKAIPPTEPFSMKGAGIEYKNIRYITHSSLPFSMSAIKTINGAQKFVLIALMVLTVGVFITMPITAFKVIAAILSLMYFGDVIFNLVVVLRSLQINKVISFTKEDLSKINDSDLPIYTVLCPLYKESHILPQFLDAISKLDYPKEKLDVLLLLEKDDKETIKVLSKMTLPFYIRKIIVPPSLPKTKPKACNYGLNLAHGEFLVIYDAEDIPDPMQLKKAYLGFKTLPKEVQCLQAKLSYYNPRANLLTRFFTVEYALWFDIMLTGLQSFNSSLPLGGTSNHFKTARLKRLQGWDPFNVTEDADLGVRLFQKGLRTAVIDSTTLEEATSQPKNWIRQRSRWIKGYMQTYFVHTRNYKDFIRQKGVLHYLIFQLTVGGKVLFILINPLMWIITALYFTQYSFAGPFLETIYAPPVSYIAVISWIFGNFLFIYYYMIACGRKKEWDLMKYVLLIPFYWAMMSYAGAKALYQLILRPHYWEKTVHGVHLVKSSENQQVVKSIRHKPIYQPVFTFIYQFSVAIKNNLIAIIALFKNYDKNSAENKKHILIFNWRDISHVYAGGAEVYIHEIAKRWVKSGSRVTIFCGNDYKNKSNETIDGIDIMRRGGSYTVYLFGFLYYIFKFRGRVQLIIDCENGIPFFSPLYARVPIILLIHHVHQDVFREFLKFPFRQIAELMEGKLMPLVYKGRQLVTVSNSSMNEIVKLGITESRKITIIPNGVNISPKSLYAKTEYPSLMYLGRLKKYKNVDIAIRAFARIAKIHENAVLSIAGYGETFPKLEILVKKLDLEENVKFLGKIDEDIKNKLLSENWVVIQPSQIEGWGITVIEANSCGTPVIASRVNGLVDSVVDGKTGLLAAPKNVDEFAKAMGELIENEKLRFELSENAYQWSHKFNWDNSATQFELLMDAVIADNKQLVPSLAKLTLTTK